MKNIKRFGKFLTYVSFADYLGDYEEFFCIYDA